MDKVKNITENTDNVEVETLSNSNFSAHYVFDSTFKLNLKDKKNHNLLQHFKGLVIETKGNVFENDVPDMMNFGVPQKDAECRFMYVLPFTKNRAIVEFTVFSEKLLSEKENLL